jgi:hypothetical protein
VDPPFHTRLATWAAPTVPNTEIVVLLGILPVPEAETAAVPTKRKKTVFPDLTMIGLAAKAAVKSAVMFLVVFPAPVIETIWVAEAKSAVLLENRVQVVGPLVLDIKEKLETPLIST